MHINHFIWDELDGAAKNRLKMRVRGDVFSIIERIQPIIGDVRFNGDAGLVAYALKHNEAEITPDQIQVSEGEFAHARDVLPNDVKEAIHVCAKNVKKFHEEQYRRIEKEWHVEIQSGVDVGERVTPVSSVGIYVPGGVHAYPSNVYMMCMPAIVAKVPEIIIVTPPLPDGSVDPAVLYAAEYCGVKKVYKASGAQAIAAMAYGTPTVPKVAKILGEAGPFGSAAKMVLSHIVESGVMTEFSEVAILSDGSADLQNLLLDMICELEHGADSSGFLITHDAHTVEFIKEHLSSCIDTLPMPQREYAHQVMEKHGAIIQTSSLEQSIEVCNEIAPGRLLVRGKQAKEVAAQILNAGEVLVGEHASSALSGYGIGLNHGLPTGGLAHSSSTTTIWDFLKRTHVAEVSKSACESLTKSASVLAKYEGFTAHLNALTKRSQSV